MKNCVLCVLVLIFVMPCFGCQSATEEAIEFAKDDSSIEQSCSELSSSCPDGFECVDKVCIKSTSDNNVCNGVKCHSNQICDEGQCREKIGCELPQHDCTSESRCVKGKCVVLSSDVSEDEDCNGVKCQSGHICDEGQCREKIGCELPQHDCTPESRCVKGKCVKV